MTHTHAPTQLDRTGCVVLFSDAFDWWYQIKTIGGICRKLSMILQNCGGVKISRLKWHWILCMTHALTRQADDGRKVNLFFISVLSSLFLSPHFSKATHFTPAGKSSVDATRHQLSSTPGEGWAWFAYYFSWDELLFGLAAVILKKKKICILL